MDVQHVARPMKNDDVDCDNRRVDSISGRNSKGNKKKRAFGIRTCTKRARIYAKNWMVASRQIAVGNLKYHPRLATRLTKRAWCEIQCVVGSRNVSAKSEIDCIKPMVLLVVAAAVLFFCLFLQWYTLIYCPG